MFNFGSFIDMLFWINDSYIGCVVNISVVIGFFSYGLVSFVMDCLWESCCVYICRFVVCFGCRLFSLSWSGWLFVLFVLDEVNILYDVVFYWFVISFL